MHHSHSIHTLDHLLEPATINNELEVKFLLINYDDISDDYQVSAAKHVYEQDKVTLGINTKDLVEFTFSSSTHLVSKFIFMPLRGVLPVSFSLATHHIGSILLRGN